MKVIGASLLVLVALVAVMWNLLPTSPSQTKSASQAVATSSVATSRHSGESTPSSDQPTVPSDQLAADFAKHVAAGRQLGAKPSSLSGTKVDGKLAVDAAGNLQVTVGVRHVFDYFLSASGEEDLDAIKSRIALYITNKLPHKAALQAWSLLHRYLGYKKSLNAIQKPQADATVAGLRTVMQRRNQARSSWLGQTANHAFFGPEEAYDRYTLKRLSIVRDDSLNQQQKQQRVAQLRNNLPPQVSQMLTQTMAPLQTAQQVKTMQKEGASQADIQAYRTQKLGAEAADRLATLDQKRAKWQQRYQQYRDQRQSIAHAGLSQQDRQAQISALRKRLFSQAEQRRVEALDRIRQ